MFQQQIVKVAIYICVLIASSSAERFKILGIVSFPVRSHYVTIKPLFMELAAKGHDVTVINQFPNSEPVENFTDIVLDSKPFLSRQRPDLHYLSQVPKVIHPMYSLMRHLELMKHSVEQDCFVLFNNDQVKQLIASQKFDVIILEQFVSDCDFVIASYFKPAPVIGILSHMMMPKHYPRIGIPFRNSVDPFFFSSSGTEPSIMERFVTVLADFAYVHYFDAQIRAQIQNSAKKYLNASVDHFDELIEDVRMLFVNQYFPLTGTRLKSDQLVDIGGIHLGQNKPLPQSIESFIDNSPNGVILMSFGSNLNVASMPKQKANAFLDAFKNIPQNVIMKWEAEEDRVENEKILFQAWLPQYDILCHPNVVGFIYHGGMLGTSEAIQCGVPMIVIPIFGDQHSNAAFITESGLGVTLYYQDITVKSVTEAVEKISTNESHKHVQRLSRAWRDRPLSALDTAVYWTEYVARHGNQFPADPRSKKVSTMKYYNIDLITVFALFCVSSMYLVYKFVHFFIHSLIRKKYLLKSVADNKKVL